ncbi:hypothetical protein TgHK011_003955 [Trichoderma gracile]|nr:hypothetical protein TgHK011_003955 [Trichoderma gracile]
MQANAEQDPRAPDKTTFVKATISRLRRVMRSTACGVRIRRRQREQTDDISPAKKASTEDIGAKMAQKAMEEAMEEMSRTLAMWDWDKIKREMDWVKLGTLDEALKSHPLPRIEGYSTVT